MKIEGRKCRAGLWSCSCGLYSFDEVVLSSKSCQMIFNDMESVSMPLQGTVIGSLPNTMNS